MEREKERRKDDILIELGFEETRVGTSADRLPRKAIKCLGLFEAHEHTLVWEARLEEFLYKVFFFEINYSPNDKTVVLIETIFMRRAIVETIAKVILPSLRSCSRSLTSLSWSSAFHPSPPSTAQLGTPE